MVVISEAVGRFECVEYLGKGDCNRRYEKTSQIIRMERGGSDSVV